MDNARGITVLRYRLRDRLSLQPGARWRYRDLWVAWLDQYSDDTCLHAAEGDAIGPSPADMLFFDSEGHGFEVVSLVPDVGPSGSEDDVDANGYPQVTARDWDWPGWDGAIDFLDCFDADGTGHFIGLERCQADPDRAPAPVALLCDADNVVVLS